MVGSVLRFETLMFDRLMSWLRCTSRADDLDNTRGGHVTWRSHDHTDALLEAFMVKELWDEYGTVGDVVVSAESSIISTYVFSIQPSTEALPRANIHELLHHVTKGTFKDHLVTWVKECLGLVHGASGAAAIMVDIDRWYVQITL